MVKASVKKAAKKESPLSVSEQYDLSEQGILDACLQFFEEEGELPCYDSGRATRFFAAKVPAKERKYLNWDQVDEHLATMKTSSKEIQSLDTFIKEHLRKPPTPEVVESAQPGLKLSRSSIKEACFKYYAEKGSRPNARVGDAHPYFEGVKDKFTWADISEILLRGKNPIRLSAFCAETNIGPIRSLSTNQLLKACRAYFDENGQRPMASSGDASKYLNLKDPSKYLNLKDSSELSWGDIDHYLIRGRNLSIAENSITKFCKANGIGSVPDDLSLEEVLFACAAYYEEHDTFPKAYRNAANPYFRANSDSKVCQNRAERFHWEDVNKRVKKGMSYNGKVSKRNLEDLCAHFINLEG